MSTLTMTVGASAASASTFFVNGTTGLDTNPCTSAGAPCKTIGAAVTKSQVALGTATIEVAAGTYKENLDLNNPADNGVTINGVSGETSGTVIEGAGTAATFEFDSPGNTAVLSNLRVVNSVGQTAAGIETAGGLTLNDVVVDIRSAGDYGGIEAEEVGSLTINGGSVTMETGNEGAAIEDDAVPLSLNGVALTVANGAKGTALEAGLAAVSLSNVTIDLGNATTNPAIETEAPSPLSANGITVSMANPSDTDPAVEQELGSGTYEHLQVGGTWAGPALESEESTTTIIRDSRLTTTGAEPAVASVESGEAPGLLFQRSIASAPPTAPYAVFVVNGNATFDSSEVLGGQDALALEQSASKQRTLTIAGSTVDAGVLGERDASGVHGVAVESVGTASVADVNIEGSIVLEPQMANVGASDTANVSCTYSDVPNQTQAATGTEGAIDCAGGVSDNTTTNPLTSLFSAPIASYNLLPGSSAIDSVPASAISLPFGITPSSTDLAGNPRIVDGNGDCTAVQDKGALELQGHSAACPSSPPPPPPPLAKAVLAILTHLQISPSSFFAAPSGATISKSSKKAKKTYGTSVSYTDSQAATTTFTVLSETSGRKQGKACAKPSKANKHGKSCTILKAIGSFVHTDTAGANKLHFSGRLGGKQLPRGVYKLQAVPHDEAGNGAATSVTFKIEG